ncbi:hypothetical protein EV183_004846 [Coemansia sp. RSA 2336]|nr:hypothetical protein EV183_004846 [Coemansia sp. RSA 2336]
MLSMLADWAFSIIWKVESARHEEHINNYRREIWPEIYGKVLDLGPGLAASLKLLQHKTSSDGKYVVDSNHIQKYVAVEPNSFLFSGLQKNAEDNGFLVNYANSQDSSQDIQDAPEGTVPFIIVRDTLDDPDKIPSAVCDNGPYDTVLTSFSLCTAENPQAALDSIFKLLKPGGTYVFLEHILHPAEDDATVLEHEHLNVKLWTKLQDWLTPFSKFFFHGCHLNRQTDKMILNMDGWESIEYKGVRQTHGMQYKLLPFVYGKAIKKA